jgi:hypothetical protein
MKIKLLTALALSLSLVAPLSMANSFVVVKGNGNTVIVDGRIASAGTKPIDEGKVKTETRQLTPFKSLIIQGAMDVEWQKSAESSISITAGENIIQHLSSEVAGDTLVLALTGNQILSTPIKIVLSCPSLGGVTVAGAGGFDGKNISGERFNLSLTGSGDIRVSGEVDASDIDVTGTGDVDASRLKTKDLKVTLMGAGDISARASHSVKVNQLGTGDITISGDPKNRSVSNLAGNVDFD